MTLEKQAHISTAAKVLVYICATVVVLGLSVGLIIGGRALHWWLVQDNTNRQTIIDRHSNSSQQSYLTRVQNGVVEVSRIDAQLASKSTQPGLAGERRAMVDQTCQFESYLMPEWVTSSIAAFAAQNCP